MTLLWNAESLWEDLEPMLPGLSIEVVANTASTNTTLLERARAEAREAAEAGGDDSPALVRRSRESAAFGRRAVDLLPCLLVAEHQTGGRGRLGRTWQSAPGASLTFSLSLPLDRIDWSGLSLAVGVALAEALDPSSTADAAPVGHKSGPSIGLKWPNDLWLLDGDTGAGAGRKLGGILIESVSVGAQRLAVIGIGLNVQPRPADLAVDLAGGAADAATGLTHGYASLDELQPGLSAPDALGRIARPLVQALLDFQRGGFSAFAPRFAARDLLRGHAVTTTLADLPHGTADGVAPSGALRVRTPDGALREVSSGEVSVRLGSTPC